MDKPKTVSLLFEVQDLADAIEGSRMLVQAFHEEQFSTEHDQRLAPASAISLLGWTVARLRLLAAVLRGEAAPIRLWSPANDTTRRAVDGEDRDVRFACEADGERTVPGADAHRPPSRRGKMARRRGRTKSASAVS